ncbi:DNA photolyase family protein [Cyclobacteriaceae bacterium]|nr:DNA photolyase family protein [Cyclobacteriaceae bacterium]
MISIFWFRRDLRLEDNTALSAALSRNTHVLPIFIFDENVIDELPANDARISFIYETLKTINSKLTAKGKSLLCLKGDPIKVWKQLITDHDIDSVYINKDYEPYAIQRDNDIEKFLRENNIDLFRYKDQVIFEENEILKNDGSPYTVYTPYKNKWLHYFKPNFQLQSPKLSNLYSSSFSFPNYEDLRITKSKIEVQPFSIDASNDYAHTRDYPSLNSTSYLGPHLRFGTVSIRQVINSLTTEDPTFLSELIWREFFMQILHHFPHVVHHNFKPKYDGISWRNNESEFDKWCNGKTGYPLVDAGMRQLNKTGYMHNRVRMIAAGFLCKHLLIDWRWGEAYFATKLLDYELSSNNGNWQWAAGTGCDAAPYFRVFNPSTQLKKFDRDLIYVKQWIPELLTLDYPLPMVDHKLARNRALESYKVGIGKRKIAIKY